MRQEFDAAPQHAPRGSRSPEQSSLACVSHSNGEETGRNFSSREAEWTSTQNIKTSQSDQVGQEVEGVWLKTTNVTMAVNHRDLRCEKLEKLCSTAPLVARLMSRSGSELQQSYCNKVK